jgi:carotenoid 1,2-hydratase
MPIISLLTPPGVADASHQVTAPGGYEWWYFDAEDSAGELRMVAIFFQGFVFHPGYLRAYGKYRFRPTRNTPPVPADYPCVYFVLYRGEEIVSQFMSQYPAESFSAATDRVSVSAGPNRLETNDDGSLQVQLRGVPWMPTGTGPKMLESQTLSANFRFAPRVAHAPMERRFFSRDWSKAEHHWVIANPLCDASGQIELKDVDDNTTTRFEIKGLGYHDHNYGTGPIGQGMRRWMWGRVLMEDHAAMFHYAQPRDVNQPDDIHMLEADPFALREMPVDRFNADWSLKTRTLLRYPAWVEAGAMQLVNPRLIDSSPFYLRLVYDASIRGAGGQAFCEIAYPHRLRWPVLGRLIERSIRAEKV